MIGNNEFKSFNFNSKKGEDSGTESDQMEKKAPEIAVSENEDDEEVEEVEANDNDESILDESVLAGGPSVKQSDDETLENEE